MIDLPKDDIEYPAHILGQLISGNSPYAFYLFQWVPYQKDAARWRLKLSHDVKGFNGKVEYGVWPNADHLGTFKDSEVEFIRLSRTQYGEPYVDPRQKAEKASPKLDPTPGWLRPRK